MCCWTSYISPYAFTLFFSGVARWNWHLQRIWQGDATLLYFLFLFFSNFFISRNSKTLKNWGNLCLCFIFLVSVNVQESMKSFFLFYSIFLLTRRCGSVYLGVVVPRVWYFEHALLQLNSCHHILPEKINPLLYLFAEPHSLYSMSQSTTIILSFHDNVWKYAHLQCLHAWSQIAT